MKFMTRKPFQAAVAIVLVAGIVLGGTFAWTNFSQNALNVFGGTNTTVGDIPSIPDVNLHDDYDPKEGVFIPTDGGGDVDKENAKAEKDIYVENSGERPIYVRVNFHEFMSINQGSGHVSIIGGAIQNNRSTWSLHSSSNSVNDSKFHTYYDWVYGKGSADRDNGRKWYLPAPLVKRAAVNALGEETAAATAISYDGLPMYGSTSSDSAMQTLEAAYKRINPIIAANQTELDNLYNAVVSAANESERLTAQSALYSFLLNRNLGYWERDKDYNFHFVPIQYTLPTNGVITMAQWALQGYPSGQFWVEDTDGWYYWAELLLPGQATGLLLSEVHLNLDNMPSGTWYYGIDVRLNAADYTNLNDLKNGASSSAQTGLDKIASKYFVGTDSLGGEYTFIKNGDNTYSLINKDGSLTTIVYTGDTSGLMTAYLNKTYLYAAGKTFSKDIPGGDNDVEFTVVGIVTGNDGNRYVKLSYNNGANFAWLSAGVDGVFNAVGTGDDVITLIDPCASAPVPPQPTVFRTVTIDSKEWIVFGSTTSYTYILSKDILDYPVTFDGFDDAVDNIKASLSEMTSLFTDVNPMIVRRSLIENNISNAIDRVALYQGTPQRWWLMDTDGGAPDYIVEADGSISNYPGSENSAGIRLAYMILTTEFDAEFPQP